MNQTIKKSTMLFTVIMMDLLAGMEFDLFVPSFPELNDYFNLSPFWVEALLSVNFLGFCISLFFVGALADRYGRKPIILIGLITFIIGSILCLWAPIYPVMLIGRFLQGIGIASPAILSFLIIADAYPIKQQQFYMAMLNGLKNASVAAAPVIGSYITLYFHWRGNFTTLLILGIITLLLSVIFIPKFQLPAQKESLSLQGYLPIFQSKPLMLLIVTVAFLFVPYWIFVGMSPLLYMEDLGVSLSHFGFYQGALALSFALGSVCYGFVIHKIDQKTMLWLSNYIFITSMILVTLVALYAISSPLIITLVILIFVIGQIVPSAIIFPHCLNYMPKMKGRVSGLVGGLSLVIQAIGLQIAGYFYKGSFQNTGIIIAISILMIVVTMWVMLNHRDLMNTMTHTE